MTRKPLIALLLTLCLVASFLQPCFAELPADSNEAQNSASVENAADGSEPLDIVLTTDDDKTEDIIGGAGITESSGDSAPAAASGDVLEYTEGTPALQVEDSPSTTQDSQEPQDQDPPADPQDDPAAPVGDPEDPDAPAAQGQDPETPAEQGQDPDAPAAQGQDPDAPAAQEQPEGASPEQDQDSPDAQAREAEPEQPAEPEEEKPEGAPLKNGAITKASVFKMMTPNANKRLEILFLNCGRNDGILLHCGGEYAFIDSGSHGNGVTARNRLRKLGVTRLKYYIGTHAHADHVGGAGPILASIKTDRIIVPHTGVISMMIKKAKGSEKSAIRRVPYSVMKYGQTITLGGATLLCVGPIKLKKAKSKSSKENYNSLVLRVTYGKRTVLLTGDAPAGELGKIRKRKASLLHVDVLKNPHHNANLKKNYSWFRMKYTVVSTSKKDKPSSSMKKKIKSVGSKLLCTAPNYNSHVLMVTDGTAIQFFKTR